MDIHEPWCGGPRLHQVPKAVPDNRHRRTLARGRFPDAPRGAAERVARCVACSPDQRPSGFVADRHRLGPPRRRAPRIFRGKLLDEAETDLEPFDVVIQKGTNHAWINLTDEPALLMGVLIDAGSAAREGEGG
jgi:hypothetical protein